MRRRKFHTTREAFTLVEVIVATAVLVLLAAGIIAAVDAGLRTANVITQQQRRQQRLDAFISWCRVSFANLPAGARLGYRVRASENGDIVELLFEQAPAVFLPEDFGGIGTGVALTAIPDGKGGATLSAMRFPSDAREEEREQVLERGKWIPLLSEVSHIQWKFLERDTDAFVDDWPRNREKPALVRLTLQQAGGVPQTVDFWIPPASASAASAGRRTVTPPPRGSAADTEGAGIIIDEHDNQNE